MLFKNWLLPRVLIILLTIQFVFPALTFAEKYVGCPTLVSAKNEATSDVQTPWKFGIPDWELYRKNLRAMGYPDHIISGKIRKLKSEFLPKNSLGYLRRIGLSTGKIPVNERFPSEKYKALAKRFTWGELGFWAGLPGFNIQKLIKTYLDSNAPHEYTHLAYWSHLWITGNKGLELLKLYATKLKENVEIEWTTDLLWMLEYLKPSDKIKFKDFFLGRLLSLTKEQEQTNFNTSSYHQPLLLSAALIAPPLRPNWLERKIKFWIDLKFYQPLISDNIRICEHGQKGFGLCEIMATSHFKSLNLYQDLEPDTQYKENVLIKLNGQLIGSLKLAGDNSLLALRNIISKDGRLLMAMGAVYSVSKDILKLAEEQYIKQKRIGNWAILELSEIIVAPHVFILSQSFNEDFHFPQLVEHSWSLFTLTDLYDLSAGQNVGFEYYSRQQRIKLLQLWQLILQLIDAKRQELENEIKL